MPTKTTISKRGRAVSIKFGTDAASQKEASSFMSAMRGAWAEPAAPPAPKKFVYVRHVKTREIVKTSDVTGWPSAKIDRLVRGLLINMSDEYFVDDSCNDALAVTP